jgi:DNA-binding transcriptional LysR family regulator
MFSSSTWRDVLDALTLDQLRVFLAVVDDGSFSAAGRRVQRVQSAVSHAMAALESELGVPLWDRSTKRPTLTEYGRALVPAARRVCDAADAMKRLAQTMKGGLEPSVAVCVDSVFPVAALVELAHGFARAFPTVELRVHTETLSAVADRVLDGTCALGVVGQDATAPGLARKHIATVQMIPVVAKEHPLAATPAPARIASETLAEHLQIVLTERGGAGRPDRAVVSPHTWRVVDLATKHALLRGGLGWGNLPEHVARADLKSGRMVRIQPAAWHTHEHDLGLAIVHRPELAPGPATRWILEQLHELCARAIEPPTPSRTAGPG